MNAAQYCPVAELLAQLRDRVHEVFPGDLAQYLLTEIPRNLLLLYRNSRVLIRQIRMACPAVDDAQLQSALLKINIQLADHRRGRIFKIDGDQIAYRGGRLVHQS